MSLTPPALAHAAPTLGQDTDAILRELGYDEREVAALREQGVTA
jgi:formyl-CoA transferase